MGKRFVPRRRDSTRRAVLGEGLALEPRLVPVVPNALAWGTMNIG